MSSKALRFTLGSVYNAWPLLVMQMQTHGMKEQLFITTPLLVTWCFVYFTIFRQKNVNIPCYSSVFHLLIGWSAQKWVLWSKSLSLMKSAIIHCLEPGESKVTLAKEFVVFHTTIFTIKKNKHKKKLSIRFFDISCIFQSK